MYESMMGASDWQLWMIPVVLVLAGVIDYVIEVRRGKKG